MSAKTPDPLDVLVGARIRVFRVHRGMSQCDLAGKIGIAFQQVQKYEKGIDRIGASRLSGIAAALGVSIGELFESAEDRYSNSKSPLRPAADQDALRFLTAVSRINDPRVRRAIAQLVEAAADLRPAMESSMARPADARRLVSRRAGKPGVERLDR